MMRTSICFVGGAVAEDEFAQLLDAGIALHADARGNIAFAGAIIFKSHGGVIFFDDEWFLRIVGGLGFLRRRFWDGGASMRRCF